MESHLDRTRNDSGTFCLFHDDFDSQSKTHPLRIASSASFSAFLRCYFGLYFERRRTRLPTCSCFRLVKEPRCGEIRRPGDTDAASTSKCESIEENRDGGIGDVRDSMSDGGICKVRDSARD